MLDWNTYIHVYSNDYPCTDSANINLRYIKNILQKLIKIPNINTSKTAHRRGEKTNTFTYYVIYILFFLYTYVSHVTFTNHRGITFLYFYVSNKLKEKKPKSLVLDSQNYLKRSVFSRRSVLTVYC